MSVDFESDLEDLESQQSLVLVLVCFGQTMVKFREKDIRNVENTLFYVGNLWEQKLWEDDENKAYTRYQHAWCKK